VRCHLVRELTFVVEAKGYRWATNMKRLLINTCKRVAATADKGLTEAENKQLRKHYRNLLIRAE
jgi:hypothetical protein